MIGAGEPGRTTEGRRASGAGQGSPPLLGARGLVPPRSHGASGHSASLAAGRRSLGAGFPLRPASHGEPTRAGSSRRPAEAPSPVSGSPDRGASQPHSTGAVAAPHRQQGESCSPFSPGSHTAVGAASPDCRGDTSPKSRDLYRSQRIGSEVCSRN